MPIDQKSLKATPYADAKRCAGCGFGVIDPLPTAQEVPAFYALDAYYTHGGTHFAKDERVNFADRLRVGLAWRFDRGEELTADRIIARAGGRPGISVCDIGCGNGATMIALAGEGARVIGVDPDPEVVSRLAGEGFDVRIGGGEALPDSLHGERFDVVLMRHSLEHCLDPMAALGSAYSIVREGGHLICETPNAAAAHFKRFTIISEMYDAPRHLYFFRPENLKAAIEKAGFRVAGDYFCGFTRHFSNSWRAEENRIRAGLVAWGETARIPPAHTRIRSWLLLAETMLAPKAAKYDSVGVFAVRE